MKVVIVHDWLTNMGGAEKVVSDFLAAFPGSTIYTSVLNRSNLSPFLQKQKIVTTFLQGKKESISNHKKYFPFMPCAFHKLKIEPCDVVLSSSSSCAKMVKIPKGAIHICFCHTPMRYVYIAKKEYLSTLSWYKRPLARLLLAYMRHVDLKSNKRVDYFIANSNEVKARIKKYYNRDSVVINPGIELDRFNLSTVNDNYYLVLSRLVGYKRFDLAVQACAESKRHLEVVGEGEEKEKLVKLANEYVNFRGRLSDKEMVEIMGRCRALIFPALEDYGITPVEAMAMGKPVICYGKGGVLDTVIDGKTGVYFSNQSVSSLLEALTKFEKTNFDYSYIRQHALKFSNDNFVKNIKHFVVKCYGDYSANRGKNQ